MTQKVLISGGAGFIGLHLANKLLDEGYQVHLIDNFSRAVVDDDFEATLKRNNVSFSNLDLLDLDAVLSLENDFFVIFHLAAIVGVRHVLKRPYSVMYDNIRMLANIIELAHRQKDFSRLLFALTSEVYAGTLNNFDMVFPTPESTPLALTNLSYPRTSYMLSKIYGEALCQQCGIPFTLFRPHNIYGPRMGMAHVIPEQLKKAYQLNDGDSIEVFSPNHTRCFCFIDDATEMLWRMMEKEECERQTLNLGSENPEIKIKELAELCFSVVGKKLSIDLKPASSGSPVRRQPNMSLTHRLTGFESQINLKDGITITYEWYRKNVFKGTSVTAK